MFLLVLWPGCIPCLCEADAFCACVKVAFRACVISCIPCLCEALHSTQLTLYISECSSPSVVTCEIMQISRV